MVILVEGMEVWEMDGLRGFLACSSNSVVLGPQGIDRKHCGCHDFQLVNQGVCLLSLRSTSYRCVL
jgi:hypothetical protein